MFNPNNGPFGGRGGFGGGFGGRRSMFGSSRYQYQTMPYAQTGEQAGSLISKVMGLLAFSFLIAFIGTFVGVATGLAYGGALFAAIGGLVVLIILQFAINKPGWNLFLLYLFTFLEGMSLSRIVGEYASSGYSYILAEAFLITAITSLGLAVYAWTTKRDFSRLGDYLFFGLILLIVASLLNIFFGGTFFTLLIAIVGVGIFSGYMLFYIQRAKYMADTLPNAIGITVSLFITVLNLFLYILEILTILQGGRNRR